MKTKSRMTIVVLCYSTSEVDLISAPVEKVKQFGDVDDFLRDYCQYDLNNISWMYNVEIFDEGKDLPNGGVQVNFLTEDSFEN